MSCNKPQLVPSTQTSPHPVRPHCTIIQRLCTTSVIISIFYTFIGLTGSPVLLAQSPVTDGVIGDAVWLTSPSEQTVQSTAISNGCGGGTYESSNPEFEAQVVHLVNKARLEHGLLPLKRVPQLDASSRFHATDMSVDGYFAHNSHDWVNGSLVESCQWSKRVETYYNDWGAIAENIAAGYKTPESVVQAWMESEGHRTNILAAGNWEIGVGYFQGNGKYTHYWVQDFGKRNNVYPVVLDGEASTTDTGNVTVHIYGDWQEVRFRTDNQNWSDWMPSQPAMHWQIHGGVGQHTVHAEMRNNTQTSTSSDTIYLTKSNESVQFADLPDELTFVYSEQEKRLSPEVHTLKPMGDFSDGYSWRAVVNGNWLRLSPETGQEPDSIEMRPTVSSASSIAPGTATVTLSLVDAGGSVVDNHSISVSLQVLNGPLNDVFIPTVMR